MSLFDLPPPHHSTPANAAAAAMQQYPGAPGAGGGMYGHHHPHHPQQPSSSSPYDYQPYQGGHHHHQQQHSPYAPLGGTHSGPSTPLSGSFGALRPAATLTSSTSHSSLHALSTGQDAALHAAAATYYSHATPSSTPPPGQATSAAAGHDVQMLEILSMAPGAGGEGTRVQCVMNATLPPSIQPPLPAHAGHPAAPPPPPQANTKIIRILFGQLAVPTDVTPHTTVSLPNGWERFETLAASAVAPNPNETGCMPQGMNWSQAHGGEAMSVPIYVQVQDGREGTILETKQAGQFTYQPGGAAGTSSPAGRLFAPNGASTVSPMASPRAMKRPGDHLVSGRASPSPSAAGNSGGSLGSSMMRKNLSESGFIPGQSPEVQSNHSGSGEMGIAHRPYLPTRYQSSPAPAIEYSHSGSGYSDAGSAGYVDYQQQHQQHQHSLPPMPQPQSLQRPEPQPHQHGSAVGSSSGSSGLTSSGGQPSLMRTSQLAPSSQFNPYVGGNSKAKLEFQQDLNLMAVGWTADEWVAKRRLVQFWRRQEGPTIHAAFRPITQAEYVPNSIVISCIYREDKNECFVTSVDAIYLLEALVGVRFSVEEKNRIRRNLEGFRPITVSKSKAGAEEFFKLVMSFPNPKPRNIEKDVKVFPWSIFGTALKKIIGKYSASYVLPPNGNMGPPQAPQERQQSPPPAPYTIPAPLMPAGGPTDAHAANGAMGFLSGQQPPGEAAGHPMNGQQHQQHQQSPYDFVDVFASGSTGGSSTMQLPPTPSATSGSSSNSLGMSSNSSGSIPTLSHPYTGGHSPAVHTLSRHQSDSSLGAGQPSYGPPGAAPGMSPSPAHAFLTKQDSNGNLHGHYEAALYR